MSLAADFTPPEKAPGKDSGSQETTFPRSTSLKILFSAYEDRLLLSSGRANREPVNVLMTRRMTIIVLGQLLARLPELSGLNKTPTQYWQEVLQMAHQNALDSASNTKTGSGEQAAGGEAEVDRPAEDTSQNIAKKQRGELKGNVYLATSLTTQFKDGQLIVAFAGLPMPRAMETLCDREPLFALSLQVENVHQLIHLLIDKAHQADWHLPVNLPWLVSPADAPATTLGLLH